MKHNYLTLVLAILFSMNTCVAFAHDFEVDGIYYDVTSIINNEVSVSYPNSNDIYSNAKTNHSYIYKGDIIIPENVVYNNKTYKVTSIGEYAFYDCDSIKSIVIPNGIISIEDCAFCRCRFLTSIDIPNSVLSIGEYAFDYCYGLTSITVPNSVTIIGNGAFRYCRNLASISMPDSLIEIGLDVFDGTAWYTSQPDGVVYAGNSIYKYKGAMPNDTTIVLKEGTRCICSNAFRNFKKLISISIPNSVVFIGGAAFEGTTWYDNMPDGLIYAGKVLYHYKGVMPDGSKIVLKDDTYSITEGAFVYCRGLSNISIPQSVKSIGSYAFSNCSGLSSIVIPDGITRIEDKLFIGCTSLISVSIPNSIFKIGERAFCYCSGLTSITIPDCVTSIGNDAFLGCSGLAKAEFSSVESLCGIAFVNDDANPLYSTHRLYVNGEEVKDLVIPNSVFSIGSFTFAGCSGLMSISIPNSVTSIGSYAFSECSGLTSAIIPNGVNWIGIYAFSGCTGLKYVTIPNSVTSIGYCAFYGCKLHDVFVNSVIPPGLYLNNNYYPFTEQTFTHAKLYIPTGCWDAYAYDKAWYKFINVRETATAKEQVSVQKAYTLMDVNAFTYSVYDPVNDCIGTIATSNGINEDNPNHCWQIVEQGKENYLYNIGAKKFAKRVDNNIVLTDLPAPIEMKDGDKGLIIGEQSANQWALVHNERMSVNQSPITGISPIINTESPTTTCYDLSGRKQSQMQRGVNIVQMNDGTTKKVLIK